MNLAMSTGNDYEYMCVTAESVLAYLPKDEGCQFYVLASDDFNDKSERFVHYLETEHPNCSLHICRVGHYFEQAELHTQGQNINIQTYYRLLIPDIVKDNKCLYLDTDIICNGNPMELYDEEIEGYMVAGVYALAYLNMADTTEYCRVAQLPAIDQYINAGVLLMNLDEMRKRDFVKNALDMIREYHPSQDQDIVNILCFDHIKHVSARNNLMLKYYDSMVWDYANIYSVDEVKSAWENPLFVHYIENNKPWEDITVIYAELWWIACCQSRVREIFFERKKSDFVYHAVLRNRKKSNRDRKRLGWHRIASQKSIVLYGAGEIARNVLSHLIENHIHIEKIVVSDLRGNPDEIYGVPVVSVTSLPDNDRNSLVLIATNEKNAISILDLLINMGFRNVICWSDIN